MRTRDIENSINEKAKGIKNALNTANKELHNTHQNILNLKSEQIKIYQKISAIYLLESSENNDINIQYLINKLQELFNSLKRRTYESEQQFLTYQQKLTDIFSQIDELTTQKSTLLENDPKYVSLLNIFKEAEENINKETRNFEELQEEFSNKLAQYKQNQYYNYLIKRNFGENNYKSLGIFRNLDTWVARFINFAENYKNQKILEALLKESQLRYDNKKELYQSALKQKEEIEKNIENNLKLPQLKNELAKSEQILANYKKQNEETNKDFIATQQGKSNEFYEIANQLARLLQQQSLNTLEQLTLQTESSEDDILFQQISKLNKQIQQLETQLLTLQQSVDTLEQTYNRINQTLYIFRQNNIPNSFYEYNFSSSNLNKLLNNLLTNSIFPETIVQALVTSRRLIDRTNSSINNRDWYISSKEKSSSRNSDNFSSSSCSSRSSDLSSSTVPSGGFKTTDSF